MILVFRIQIVHADGISFFPAMVGRPLQIVILIGVCTWRGAMEWRHVIKLLEQVTGF